MGFINWAKGVLTRMFGKTDLEKVIESNNIAISNDMLKAIEKWKAMLYGQAPWISYNPNKPVVSLKLESAICREFSDVVLSEMTSKVTVSKLDNIYKKVTKDLNEELQKGLALGSFIIKPLGIDSVEYVTADNFIPIEYDNNKRLRKVLFIETKMISEREYYRRFEYHELNEQGLTITNKCYKSSTSNDIGQEISLQSVTEWSKLQPRVTFTGVTRPIFGYYRNPLPNLIDNSSCGVSIYDSAVDQIEEADKTYSYLRWEFKSGQRQVFADPSILKERQMSDGTYREYLADDTGLFKVLDIDKGVDNQGLLETFSPEFREQNILNSMQEHLRRIEFNVGLSYGDISNPQYVEKTATEVKTAKKRKYNRVTAIENNLKECLEDLVYGIAFFNSMVNSNYEFICGFKDSVTIDEETERLQDRQDVASGFMNHWEYRMKWYGETEAQAKASLPRQTDVID